VSPSGHTWAWNVWRVKAALVVALAALLLAATCQVPTYGTPPAVTGGTGGAPVATGGTPSAGSAGECRWVPSSGRARRADASRIVGGQVSAEQQWPSVVALEEPDGWQYCGGTVIGSRVVLTAAHCQVRPGDVVHAGTIDLREPGRRVVVVEARNHPDWHHTTSGWDVAVLYLASDAGVSAAPLVAASASFSGTAFAVGWGATCSGCSTVPLQRWVEVPLASWAACQITYAGQLNHTMLCAGGDGVDSCQGDSGGPLFTPDGSTLGIVSWGRGCADAPGVYTDVRVVRDWIEECSSW